MHRPNPMLPALPPATLTTKLTAEYLGVSESTVRGLIRDLKLPRVKLGRRVLVRRIDADALLAKLAAASISTPESGA